jgi:hypothetical protein
MVFGRQGRHPRAFEIIRDHSRSDYHRPAVSGRARTTNQPFADIELSRQSCELRF